MRNKLFQDAVLYGLQDLRRDSIEIPPEWLLRSRDGRYFAQLLQVQAQIQRLFGLIRKNRNGHFLNDLLQVSIGLFKRSAGAAWPARRCTSNDIGQWTVFRPTIRYVVPESIRVPSRNVPT